MRFSRILGTAITITCLTVTTAFAAPITAGSAVTKQSCAAAKEKCEKFSKDPLKALQNKKEIIRAHEKDGKITKAKADAINARIDAKIKEIQQFNSLTVQQKRAKLINDYKASVTKRVKSGKLTQDKADTMIKDFTDKITRWDGTGYPQFHGKRFKDKAKSDSTANK